MSLACYLPTRIVVKWHGVCFPYMVQCNVQKIEHLFICLCPSKRDNSSVRETATERNALSFIDVEFTSKSAMSEAGHARNRDSGKSKQARRTVKRVASNMIRAHIARELAERN